MINYEIEFISKLNSWTDKIEELNLPDGVLYGTWLKQNDISRFNRLYQEWRRQLDLLQVRL